MITTIFAILASVAAAMFAWLWRQEQKETDRYLTRWIKQSEALGAADTKLVELRSKFWRIDSERRMALVELDRLRKQTGERKL